MGDIKRHFARRLDGIDVHRHAMLGGKSRQSNDVEHDARFVVCVLQGNQGGFRCDAAAKLIFENAPFAIHPHVIDLITLLGQSLHDPHYGRMLDSRGDNLATVSPAGQHPTNGQIDALRTSAGEHYFFGLRTKQRRHLDPRRFHPVTNRLTKLVNAGWIGVVVAQAPGDRFHDLGKGLGRCVIVKVDHVVHTWNYRHVFEFSDMRSKRGPFETMRPVSI